MKLIQLIFSVKNVPTVKWSSPHPLNYKPRFDTLIFLILGVFLFGLGDAIIISSGTGVSPWTVLAQGISNITNLSIGISTFIISIAILILWIPLKQQPGIGTILNAIIIAAAIDLTLPYLPHPSSYPIQVFQAIIGILVTGLGSGTYLIEKNKPTYCNCENNFRNHCRDIRMDIRRYGGIRNSAIRFWNRSIYSHWINCSRENISKTLN